MCLWRLFKKIMQDPRKFKYSSDYVIPSVVYKKEGSFYNSTGNLLIGQKFEHHLPFTPLVFGIWSEYPDYSQSHSIPTGLGYTSVFVAFADDTYIYVRGGNAESAVTYYYKLYAYPPSDYQGITTPLDNPSDLLFTTDKNYLQIYSFGKVKPNGRTSEVAHGLGYIPFYRVWKTTDYGFWDDGEITIRALGATESFYDANNSGYERMNVIDNTRLTISWPERQPDDDDYAYYQIYINEG